MSLLTSSWLRGLFLRSAPALTLYTSRLAAELVLAVGRDHAGSGLAKLFPCLSKLVISYATGIST